MMKSYSDFTKEKGRHNHQKFKDLLDQVIIDTKVAQKLAESQAKNEVGKKEASFIARMLGWRHFGF